MKQFSNVFLCAFFGLATLTMGCAEMNSGSSAGTGTTGGETKKGNVSAVNTGSTRVSQGTQGDSLKACLSRIPSDASAGQLQLATLTCERDAQARQAIDAVPGK
jgi:hypothetical protein